MAKLRLNYSVSGKTLRPIRFYPTQLVPRSFAMPAAPSPLVNPNTSSCSERSSEQVASRLSLRVSGVFARDLELDSFGFFCRRGSICIRMQNVVAIRIDHSTLDERTSWVRVTLIINYPSSYTIVLLEGKSTTNRIMEIVLELRCGLGDLFGDSHIELAYNRPKVFAG